MKRLVLAGLMAAALGGASGAQAMTFGNWLSGKPAPQQRAPVIQVQTSPELQIQQLEETVRTLTGRVEDLNYQLLQMQEQMRKTQEDNEFRFQQLEKKAGGKKADLGSPGDTNGPEAADAAASGTPADNGASAPTGPAIADGSAATDNTTIENQAAAEQPAGSEGASNETTHLQPGTLGSLIFNGDGQIVDTTRNPEDNSADKLPGVQTGSDVVGRQIEESGKPPAGAGTTMEQASIPPKADSAAPSADETYQKAYQLILSGDYAEAEKSFTAYLEQYPEGTKASDASFWLGEAQYSQGRYNDAAKTFLAAYKTYGESQKAPEILLKLGMSLAALDNKDTACATFREIPKRYPNASKAVMSKVTSEQSRLACPA